MHHTSLHCCFVLQVPLTTPHKVTSTAEPQHSCLPVPSTLSVCRTSTHSTPGPAHSTPCPAGLTLHAINCLNHSSTKNPPQLLVTPDPLGVYAQQRRPGHVAASVAAIAAAAAACGCLLTSPCCWCHIELFQCSVNVIICPSCLLCLAACFVGLACSA